MPASSPFPICWRSGWVTAPTARGPELIDNLLEWIKAGDFGADGPVLLRRLLSDTEDRNPDLLEKLRPKLPEGVTQSEQSTR